MGVSKTMRLLGRLDNAAVDNRLAVSESCIVQLEQLVEEAEESRDNRLAVSESSLYS